MSRLCIMVLLALLGAGCSDPRARAVGQLSRTSPQQLRQDAALLYKETFSGHGTDFVVIRPKRWPDSFKAFSPLRVGAYPDGISLAIQSSKDLEAGLYVVPRSMDHEPGGTRGGSFEKLAEGVYWYSFGSP